MVRLDRPLGWPVQVILTLVLLGLLGFVGLKMVTATAIGCGGSGDYRHAVELQGILARLPESRLTPPGATGPRGEAPRPVDNSSPHANWGREIHLPGPYPEAKAYFVRELRKVGWHLTSDERSESSVYTYVYLTQFSRTVEGAKTTFTVYDYGRTVQLSMRIERQDTCR